MIDTHCHLTFPDYEGIIGTTLEEARRSDVFGAITVSTTSGSCLACRDLADRHANVWCTSGVHPLYADKGPHDWDAVRESATSEKCVAWGELGLDNHYSEPAKGVQHAVLEEQLAFIERCREEDPERLDLPVVIHCREAFDELIPILRDTSLDPARFVFHCFTSGPREMRMLLDFGASVSFTGVVTYKNAKDVQEAARIAPDERIMVETDAPFLTPHPHRGVKPNAPKFSRVIAEFLAELRGASWDEFHATIDANTQRFFGVPAPSMRERHESTPSVGPQLD